MKQKIKLEIEELEERIAPHFGPLGGGHSQVEFNAHGGGELQLPNGKIVEMPDAAIGGLSQAKVGGGG